MTTEIIIICSNIVFLCLGYYMGKGKIPEIHIKMPSFKKPADEPYPESAEWQGYIDGKKPDEERIPTV